MVEEPPFEFHGEEERKARPNRTIQRPLIITPVTHMSTLDDQFAMDRGREIFWPLLRPRHGSTREVVSFGCGRWWSAGALEPSNLVPPRPNLGTFRSTSDCLISYWPEAAWRRPSWPAALQAASLCAPATLDLSIHPSSWLGLLSICFPIHHPI